MNWLNDVLQNDPAPTETREWIESMKAVLDADGTYLGKYRKHHIPNLDRFWEKFYFRPGNLGYPVFDTAVGKVGVYICYDRHFPEGWRELGLNGAHISYVEAARATLAWRRGDPGGAIPYFQRAYDAALAAGEIKSAITLAQASSAIAAAPVPATGWGRRSRGTSGIRFERAT
mgnify:CR=1 FL=1